jgi:hypothetical protein
VQQQQPQQQQQQQAEVLSDEQQQLLAMALLRALQLHPRLCRHAWRGSLWCQLLSLSAHRGHAQQQQQQQQQPTAAVLAWCAVQALSVQLGLPDAVGSQLMQAHLGSVEARVQAMAR